MGLLEEKSQVDARATELSEKLNFYRPKIDSYEPKRMLAWIDDDDGHLVFNNYGITKQECIEICQWYLNIVGEL